MAESVSISGNRDTGRWGTAHPSVVPYRAFRTSDGEIIFGGGNDWLFGILCKWLGRPEWASDERFSVNYGRVTNRKILEPWIENVTEMKSTEGWLEIFDGTGLPYTKVNDLLDTITHKHVLARDVLEAIDHPSCGPMKLINTTVKYSHAQPSVWSPPPTLGQHLIRMLGSWDRSGSFYNTK